MNGDKASIDTLVSWLVEGPLDKNTEVVVGVPGCYLQYVNDKLSSSQVSVAAQNCYKANKGAFTGEFLVCDDKSAFINSYLAIRRVSSCNDSGLWGSVGDIGSLGEKKCFWGD